MDRQTLPDSPAPSNSILISFFAIIRSRFSWLSISSLPAQRRQSVLSLHLIKGQPLTGLGLVVDA